MDGGIISSCKSAATSEIVKTLLATISSHVRSAIASTGLNLQLYKENMINSANTICVSSLKKSGKDCNNFLPCSVQYGTTVSNLEINEHDDDAACAKAGSLVKVSI